MDEDEKAAWLRMKPMVIFISAEAWEDLQRALKEPPKANERMRRLLTEPSVFERD